MGEKTRRDRMCDNCLHGHATRCMVPWCPCICRQPVSHLDSPKVRMWFKDRTRSAHVVPRMIVIEDNGEPKRILYKRFMEQLNAAPMNGNSKGEEIPKLLIIPTNKEIEMTTRSKRQQGFSLLELVVAMAIGLIITAAGVFAYSTATRAAHQNAGLESVQTLAKAMPAYLNEFGTAAATANLTATSALTATYPLGDSSNCAAGGPTAVLACIAPTGVIAADTNYTYSIAYTSPSVWAVTATPTAGSSNNKAYCVDQSGTPTYSQTVSTPASGVVAGTPATCLGFGFTALGS